MNGDMVQYVILGLEMVVTSRTYQKYVLVALNENKYSVWNEFGIKYAMYELSNNVYILLVCKLHSSTCIPCSIITSMAIAQSFRVRAYHTALKLLQNFKDPEGRLISK